jgi:hypothetical protein
MLADDGWEHADARDADDALAVTWRSPRRTDPSDPEGGRTQAAKDHNAPDRRKRSVVESIR